MAPRRAPRPRRQTETLPLQPYDIPPQIPVDSMNAFLEALRALPMKRQDLISSRQSQLAAFVKAGPRRISGADCGKSMAEDST